MNKKTLRTLIGWILLFSLSCNFFTGLIPGGGTSGSGAPLVAKGDGPAGLTAEATSADSVKLTWQPVEGAASYHIAVSINGAEAFSLMDLAPSVTSYEDFMAMPGGQLKYAVEALSDSGSIGQAVVDVTTPERKPNPLTVDAQLDANKTASATIGPEGGSISLKDAKGVEYKLDIPATALDIPVDITLTSVKNIGGWPLDGDMLGAVKIEPEGLTLNEMATLSITLPDDQPSNNFVNLGFAYTGNGTEFHLKPVYDQSAGTGFVPELSGGGHLSSPVKQNGAEIVMETLVMYGIGVGEGTADGAGELARYHAPTDTGAALDQKQAAASAKVNEVPKEFLIIDRNNSANIEVSVYGSGVNLAITLAENCDQLKQAVYRMDSWGVHATRALNKGAQPDKIKALEQSLWDNLTDKIKEVVGHAAEECEKKPKDTLMPTAEAGCLDLLLSKIANPPNPFYQTLQDKMTTKFDRNAVADWQGFLEKCVVSIHISIYHGPNLGTEEADWCNIARPFAFGGKTKYTFLPSADGLSGGILWSTADLGGFSFSGAGSYRIELDYSLAGPPPNPTMKMTSWSSVLHSPVGGGPRDDMVEVTLTMIKCY